MSLPERTRHIENSRHENGMEGPGGTRKETMQAREDEKARCDKVVGNIEYRSSSYLKCIVLIS